MIDVSFVIVSWNAREHLDNCLRSIEKLSCALAVETLVVDNASDDGSPELVDKNYPNVRLIRNEKNLGFAQGNNIGIQRASGEFICLINSDVILHQGCVEKLVDFLRRDPSVGLCGPRIVWADGAFQPSCKRSPRLWASLLQALWLDKPLRLFGMELSSHLDTEHQTLPMDVDVLVGCFWMARAEAVQEVGGLDERYFMYCEDDDWCRRFRERHWRVAYAPLAESTHVGGASSDAAPVRFLVERERAQSLYWRKHGGILAQCAHRGICLLNYGLRLAVWSGVALFSKNKDSKASLRARQCRACSRWALAREHKETNSGERRSEAVQGS